MKKCNNCGYENPDDYVYCKYCGQKFDKEEIPDPDNKYKRWVGILSVTIVVQIIILMLIHNGGI